MDVDIMNIKSSCKVVANRLNLLVVIKKQTKTKPYHFSTHIVIKGNGGHYIWYQSKVKTLGPDGLIDMQVCFQLCDLIL